MSLSKGFPINSNFLARKKVDRHECAFYIYSMHSISERKMIQAMTDCDSSYNGKFYVGVTSTKIYCLPSCKAKLPLLKNVTFFNTREEAIAFGLRGCKRCKSETFPDVLPSWVHLLLVYMKDNYKKKLSEESLMKITGVEISTIRRYFKQHHKTTPLAFHRKLRLNYALALISSGSSYLDAAFETGWESSSGFREAFQKQFGQTPGSFYNEQN